MSELNPELVLFIGAGGCLLGFIFLIYFLYGWVHWLIDRLSKHKIKSPGFIKGIRNLIFIIIWIGFFVLFLMLGFFMRAYDVFTFEKPVAEVVTEPVEQKNISRITLSFYSAVNERISSETFQIASDQWVLEGDIIKWDNWVNLLGIQTRYRFTRLRGRYQNVEDELKNPPEIFPLVKDENHPIWKYFYRYGYKLPFVNTVYGNAVFQSSDEKACFRIFVGNSGFIVKRIEDDEFF